MHNVDVEVLGRDAENLAVEKGFKFFWTRSMSLCNGHKLIGRDLLRPVPLPVLLKKGI